MPRPDGCRHIVDVLRDHFGEHNFNADYGFAQSERQIEHLADSINEHVGSWRPPPLAEQIRTFGGSYGAGDLRPGIPREALLTQALYVDSTLVPDPMARYFDPEAGQVPLPEPAIDRHGQSVGSIARTGFLAFGHYAPEHDLFWTRYFLAETLPLYAVLAPLYDQGVLIDIPAQRVRRDRSEAILEALSEDVDDRGMAEALASWHGWPPLLAPNLRGPAMDRGEIEDHLEAGLYKPIVQAPGYMLNADLAMAAIGGGQYIPPYRVDYALLDAKLVRVGDQLSAAQSAHVKVLPALKLGVLPKIGKLEVRTVLEARANEEAFEAWRSALRNIVRSVPEQLSEERFEEELAEAAKDYMTPAIAEVEAAVGRSNVLARVRGSTAEAAVSGIIGAGVLTVATLNPLGAAAGFVASGSAKLVREAFFPAAPKGSHAVVARLIQD